MPRRPPKLSKVEHSARCQQANLAAGHNAVEVRLFKMPAEIRNAIYRFALLANQSHIKCANVKRYDPLQSYVGLKLQIPGLLSASKQLREEASGVFYGNNTFLVCYSITNPSVDTMTLPYKLPKDLKEFPSSMLSMVKNLQITVNFKFEKCNFPADDNNNPRSRHVGEVHFIIADNKFTLHGEYIGCVTEDILAEEENGCPDATSDFVENYALVIKCLVMGKLDKANEKSDKDDGHGRTLIRAPRDEMPWPEMTMNFFWHLCFEGSCELDLVG